MENNNERAAFEAWAKEDGWTDGEMAMRDSDGYIVSKLNVAWRAWRSGRAALASRPAEVDDEGLPPLPPPTGIVEYVVAGDQTTHIADAYTAEQFRQGQRDVVAADRARRGGKP